MHVEGRDITSPGLGVCEDAANDERHVSDIFATPDLSGSA